MSKTIEIKLYGFNELNETAQKVAIEENRNWIGETQSEIDGDSFHWTLEKMEEVLGVCIREDDFGWVLGVYGERWEEVMDNPKYLARYINWVAGRVDTLKTYYLPFEKSRYYHPSMTPRKSNIVSGGFVCSLTGEWTDSTFDKWMTDANDWIRSHKTIREFVDSLIREFHSAWDEDIEWGYSDDNVRDILEQRGEFFLENGHKFDHAI